MFTNIMDIYQIISKNELYLCGVPYGDLVRNIYVVDILRCVQ